ncbi:hypothetical protein CROQUDRAFT_136769 [Cronartium quercuum f. sp. fusiforme G11]|uniref:Uncharacterized protein n=1 Tax=Cronartium quercuum f. sp. fusiforme G11 TaxID=708437 RepID=A0A9P6N6W1_9BASI|nr:hypothetical protein CROQUDRAFT_136769 [Cronartium quercuum f. sp. fusiforme G11]
MTSDLTSGTHDTSEFEAVKSATDLPASEPKSQICRRGLNTCFGAVREEKIGPTTPTETRASESDGVTKTTAKLSVWQKALDWVLWKLPKARDEYNLAYANYETFIIETIALPHYRSELSHLFPLYDDLLPISITRQRMTSEFGYGQKISKWLMKDKMPELAGKFRETLENTMNNLISSEAPPSALERSAAIVKKIYESERQDKFLQPKLKKLDKLWSLFIEKFPDLDRVTKETGLDQLAFPPSRPRFPGWTRLRPTPSLGRDLSWIDYQSELELDQRGHLQVLSSRKEIEVEGAWQVFLSSLNKLEEKEKGSSLVAQLKKGYFGIEQYKNLEALEQSRLGLIQVFENEARKALSTELDTTPQLQALAMQGLVIETISGMYSRTALHMLEDLSSRGHHLADQFLEAAIVFQDKSGPPPEGREWLTVLRKRPEPKINLRHYLARERKGLINAPPKSSSWLTKITDPESTYIRKTTELRRLMSL